MEAIFAIFMKSNFSQTLCGHDISSCGICFKMFNLQADKSRWKLYKYLKNTPLPNQTSPRNSRFSKLKKVNNIKGKTIVTWNKYENMLKNIIGITKMTMPEQFVE